MYDENHSENLHEYGMYYLQSVQELVDIIWQKIGLI